ncbi:HEAT repeat domain-containing protein [Zavarzinella formosa]|uniref:HEAT repeat domain-containing protein n=1 Tax=Zavarzinella formosa TaxID=360055 RepID=UPI0003118989|nr:HEAT repeat domain-containing protein [Zavarzinella formosa]
MFDVLRSRWLATALAFAGIAFQSRADAPVAYKPDQHIIVRIGTKGDRRCVIIAAKPQADGTIEYRMKAIDNGEVLTIYDRPGSGATRPLPAESASQPKPSVSSDPLLASSLRQPTGAKNADPAKSDDVSKPGDTALATAPTKRDGPLHRLQELIPIGSKNQERPAPGVQTPVIVTRANPIRQPQPVPTDMMKSASNIGTAMIDGTGGMPGKTISTASSGTAMVVGEPAPLNMVRRPAALPAVAEPVSLGFVIPVNNSQTTPKARNYEREERIVSLGDKLKNALQPSARENAAELLTEGVGADSAAVRSLLLTAAANDPSANVRATCVRCLVKIGVRDTPFLALLATGKQDPDVRVRLEIDRAEEMLK